jgi:hypothetical protein
MFRIFAIIAAGIALGIGSAVAAILTLGAQGAAKVGPWQTPIDAGGPNRGAYLRAATALRATLALSRQEAIYFRATTDSQGHTLRGDCTYRVHGPDLPAKWWSITLYGADHYLIPNAENRYAIASVNAAADPAPSPPTGFSIAISPNRQPGDWLDTGHTSRIVLLARLYLPQPAAAAAPAAIAMPAIDLEGCP